MARPARSRAAALHALAGAALIAVLPSALPAQEAEERSDPYAGTWDVTGRTVDERSGDVRLIQGHVVLTRKGDGYVAAAEMETQYPTHGGPMRTDVIGTGDGVLEGDRLRGTASTQLVIQSVPGVDTDFAFVPRYVGPRLVSTWTARIQPDGTLHVELLNEGREGEDYNATRTTLRGRRVVMPAEAARETR